MNKKVLFSIIIYFVIYIFLDLLKLVLEIDPTVRAVMNLIIVPVLLIIVLFLLKDELKNTPFRKKKYSVLTSIFIVIMGFLLLVFGQKVISTILVKIVHLPAASSNSEALLETIPLLILIQAILAPILEELIFRRGIQGFFYEKFNPIISIVLTSVIFAAWHMSLIGFLAYFWTSLIFSSAYYFTNRLVVPITIHILLNSLVGLAILIG